MVTGVAEQHPPSMEEQMGHGHVKRKLCVFFFVLSSVSSNAGLSLLNSRILASEGEVVSFLSTLDHVPLFSA